MVKLTIKICVCFRLGRKVHLRVSWRALSKNGVRSTVLRKAICAALSAAANADAARPLRCAKLKYAVKQYEADMLFQGALKEPEQQAKALGFTTFPVKTLETGCANELESRREVAAGPQGGEAGKQVPPHQVARAAEDDEPFDHVKGPGQP